MNYTHIKGTTFDEVNMAWILNGVPFNFTGCTLKMQLRKEYEGLVFLSLTSVGNSGITITNASGGLFKINKQIIDIPAFEYLHDIELTKADGTVKNYMAGVFSITNRTTE